MRNEHRLNCQKKRAGTLNKHLCKFAHQLTPRTFNASDREDVAQEVRLHLWTKSLPRYDAWRLPKTKVSTYIYKCAWQATRNYAESLSRQRKHACKGLHNHATARDSFHDRRVEDLADLILHDPGVLRDRHARALILQPHGEPDAVTAAGLGIAKQTLFEARVRVRQKCRQLLDVA